MSNTVEFMASYSATAAVTARDVWAVWADVNAWHQWDHGIERAELAGDFAAGATFSLLPHGGEPIEITLKTVVVDQEFSDEAQLPFGVIRTFHKISPSGHNIVVTHEVRAEIAAEAADFFAEEIWPHMQGGLPDAVNGIVALILSR